MIPLSIMAKIRSAQQAIAGKDRTAAVQLIDEIAEWLSAESPNMNTTERLQFIGGTADMYSQIGETAKEIPLWERLCGLAENDLKRLGLMASSEDLLRSAFDFLRLGRAYRKQKQTQDAQRAFDRAAKLLCELNIEIDTNQLLTSDGEVFIGEHEGNRMFVS